MTRRERQELLVPKKKKYNQGRRHNQRISFLHFCISHRHREAEQTSLHHCFFTSINTRYIKQLFFLIWGKVNKPLHIFMHSNSWPCCCWPLKHAMLLGLIHFAPIRANVSCSSAALTQQRFCLFPCSYHRPPLHSWQRQTDRKYVGSCAKRPASQSPCSRWD